MREKVTTAAEFVGAGFVCVGLALAWLPLGLIAAGVAMIGAGFLVGDEP